MNLNYAEDAVSDDRTENIFLIKDVNGTWYVAVQYSVVQYSRVK
jgi:hypothetical protein